MNRNKPGISRSRYRQLRITATHETNGTLSVSVYAKPLNKEWHEHQCLVRRSVAWEAPLNSTEDVILALIHLLEEDLLPGIG